jgi:antitoxin (DNA-binding transcriptional repressor) of toxin-antitoxin stability system
MTRRLLLTDTAILEHQSEEITATAFRAHPGDVLLQVQLGKTFTITKNGKPIAVLSRPEPTALELAAEVRRLGLAGNGKDTSRG